MYFCMFIFDTSFIIKQLSVQRKLIAQCYNLTIILHFIESDMK